MREVAFELKEHLGVVTERKDGLAKEINIVEWNGGEPKIDIRDWSPEHERMTRGLTLTVDEAKELFGSYSNWRENNEVADFEAVVGKKVGENEYAVYVIIHEFIHSIPRSDGWSKGLHIASWNGGSAKVDIRNWSGDFERMSRGITLCEEEADKIAKIIEAKYKEVA